MVNARNLCRIYLSVFIFEMQITLRSNISEMKRLLAWQRRGWREVKTVWIWAGPTGKENRQNEDLSPDRRGWRVLVNSKKSRTNIRRRVKKKMFNSIHILLLLFLYFCFFFLYVMFSLVYLYTRGFFTVSWF